MKTGFVYMMSNSKRTTLYIGVTNDIERRVLEHKIGMGSKFTSKYNRHYLLFFEELPCMNDAIDREKQLKNWHKEWKWNLIKENNPSFTYLAKKWYRNEDLNRDLY